MIAAKLIVTKNLNTPEVQNRLLCLFEDIRNLHIKLMDKKDPRAWKCKSFDEE